MPDPAIVLRGEGFSLRPWAQDDLASLVKHANDERVSRGLRDRFPFPYTQADGEAFLAGRVLKPGDISFAIEAGGEACGGVGLEQGVGERARSAELGYWLVTRTGGSAS